MNGRICQIIHSICKEQDINYCSKYYEESVFTRDAQSLAKIYKTLKGIIDELTAIGNRHNLDSIGKLLIDDIHILVTIDHDLIVSANKIVKEQYENKESQ
jgi:hypothetical protein